MNRSIEMSNQMMSEYLNLDKNPNDFHTNWNSLMMVLNKIRDENHAVHIKLDMDETDVSIDIHSYSDRSLVETVFGHHYVGIVDMLHSYIYAVVAQFLDWYGENVETSHYIECECGQCEEFPSDTPRHKSQHFTHIDNLENGEAEYVCMCGNRVRSITIRNDNNEQ